MQTARAGVSAAIVLTVASGLGVHRLVPGDVGGYLGDALYAVLIYLLLLFARPAAAAPRLWAAATAVCWLIEAAQLTGWPAELSEKSVLARLVLGSGFNAGDLAAYAAGAAAAAALHTLAARRRADGDEQLERIAAKVAAAAEVPGNLDIFGAGRHRFELNPPLPEETVAAFERAHGVRLPEDYRRFVTGLADGGAGPGYGLLPLADAYDADTGPLAAPSPFAPGVTYTGDWWDGHIDEDLGRDPRQGTLAIVHHGCTSYTLLVVSGPARGRLVSVDHNGDPAPYVLEDTGFLAWYERWLDELAAGHDVTRITDKIPGGEAELLAIAAADPDPARRARAVWSLCPLPELSPAGRRALAGLAADPVAPVRAAALRTVRRFRAAEAGPAARTALGDDDPAVRAAAVSALRDLQIPDLAAVARTMLGDPDQDVVIRAVWALLDSGELTVADLAPLTSSPDPGIRATGLHYLRDATGDGADALLAAALGDGEARSRWTAVQGIEHRELRHLHPLLEALLETETDPTVLTNLRRAVPKLSPHSP
ncbi:DUF2809 domain-containing protein [Actinomadura macrotermitis]|uniref:Knr4/Smi1-like domain-containing protein n=1 Tax=Actinomadura macrotermitis TaxID=2585200 RepID=A0A7K0C673_9ACTN|nr:DUF2809 domain-containing protein [Actinomadura macrotermitis]MQY08959.1 hypothetical protein [Actinomadura macrotermitis]